ncbi:casein kinase I [Drosophila bipectinata]|uniref:casein kinase I n=1 Tax=Drosophila bipectinata TaxID=42026 RepID=UPI001C8A4CE6|nr:casein kinase I [Drosophila bipectinata]
MSDDENSDGYLNQPMVIRDYLIRRKIGSGSFGDIFMAEQRITGERVAIKVERNDTNQLQLYFEFKLYKIIQGGIGIPRIREFNTESRYNMLVMELLGPSLEEMFVCCSRRFSLKTVLMLADQMIERLDHLHSHHYLHRDVKPENFLMGLGANQHRVYIIDMGLAKSYWNSESNKHVSYKNGHRLTGTARYASVNALNGGEQSRRDDLESVGYVLMYFLRGNLPWQGLKAVSKKQRYELIAETKASTRLEDLCLGFPEEFASYIGYCRAMGFEDKPHYNNLRKNFADLMERQKYINDRIYDWNLLQMSKENNKKEEKDNIEAKEDTEMVFVH